MRRRRRRFCRRWKPKPPPARPPGPRTPGPGNRRRATPAGRSVTTRPRRRREQGGRRRPMRRCSRRSSSGRPRGRAGLRTPGRAERRWSQAPRKPQLCQAPQKQMRSPAQRQPQWCQARWKLQRSRTQKQLRAPMRAGKPQWCPAQPEQRQKALPRTVPPRRPERGRTMEQRLRWFDRQRGRMRTAQRQPRLRGAPLARPVGRRLPRTPPAPRPEPDRPQRTDASASRPPC